MLDIQNLQVELEGDAGLVRAIDGMRLSIERVLIKRNKAA